MPTIGRWHCKVETEFPNQSPYGFLFASLAISDGMIRPEMSARYHIWLHMETSTLCPCENHDSWHTVAKHVTIRTSDRELKSQSIL
eukprot:1133162-Amphidinium_carterae.1